MTATSPDRRLRRATLKDAVTLVVILLGLAALLGAGLFAHSTATTKGGLHPGDRRSTPYGVVTVVEGPLGPELRFPDCTPEMRTAGGGRLVDFDPVEDAHIPPPEGASTWAWDCGTTP